MKVDDDIKKKSAELIAGAANTEEKVQKLYEFCRANIKNTDDKDTGFTDEQLEKIKENKKPSDTLKRGVGSGGDINLLFAALTNAAGIGSSRHFVAGSRQAVFRSICVHSRSVTTIHYCGAI
jgi:hypothetical protein